MLPEFRLLRTFGAAWLVELPAVEIGYGEQQRGGLSFPTSASAPWTLLSSSDFLRASVY